MFEKHGLATHHKITKVIVVSLACADMASGPKIERSSMSHIDDVIGMMAYLDTY